MILNLGIKTDPIEYRYSYQWLFHIMNSHNIRHMQLGSFFEMYSVGDEYFHELRELAARKSILIKSCFTAHRELGGFFSGNPYLIEAARKNWERFIHIASLLGADYAGSNAGTVYRDRMDTKEAGIKCYLSHMKDLMFLAKDRNLKGLTLEPMSCKAEPPSLPEEIDIILETLTRHHRKNIRSTVPFYICADIGHGIADSCGNILHSNVEIFKHGIPYMIEFHVKNTDRLFSSTFGFSGNERTRGIVDLEEIRKLLLESADGLPGEEVTAYLELEGPKLGREYSDIKLREMIDGSIKWIKSIFDDNGSQ